MECCNSKNSHKDFATPCNACGKAGKPVKKKTLEHLVKEDRVSLVRDTQLLFGVVSSDLDTDKGVLKVVIYKELADADEVVRTVKDRGFSDI
ncbi:MAG: hypothetical protein HRF42_09980 [Candidatus Brocadia sp.]